MDTEKPALDTLEFLQEKTNKKRNVLLLHLIIFITVLADNETNTAYACVSTFEEKETTTFYRKHIVVHLNILHSNFIMFQTV